MTRAKLSLNACAELGQVSSDCKKRMFNMAKNASVDEDDDDEAAYEPGQV